MLNELKVAIKNAAARHRQRRDGVTIRIVELRRLNDERHRLQEIRFRNRGCDVNVSGVAVQLEVLVLVRVATEGVKDGSPEAEVFVEGFQFLRLHHQLLAFGVALRKEGVVAVVEKGRVLIVGILSSKNVGFICFRNIFVDIIRRDAEQAI
jgi:hypothetical protein